MAVAEVRAVALDRRGRAQHHLRIDGGQRQHPAAGGGLVPWRSVHGAHPAAGRSWLGTAPLARDPVGLPDVRERGDRRVDGAAGRPAAGPHEPLDAQWDALGQVLHGEVRAEVVRDGVEAAAVHQPGAGLGGRAVVPQVHQVDELGLAGDVGVVGAGLRAGGDQ